MRCAAILAVLFLFTTGCASDFAVRRVAGGQEHLCKHCNCLMLAGTDLYAMCSVCNCKKRGHECLRGH